MDINSVSSVMYPCRGCVYFSTCGNTNRMVPCQGRVTKTMVKHQAQVELDPANDPVAFRIDSVLLD